jgi:hypothetical protein
MVEEHRLWKSWRISRTPGVEVPMFWFNAFVDAKANPVPIKTN